MRIPLLSILSALLIATSPVFAQTTADAPGDQPQSADQSQWEKQVDRWQQRMNEMHRQMDEINRTTDPEKRRQLLEEHWKLMDEQMLAMRMMGGGMMGHTRDGHHRGRHRHMTDPETDYGHIYDRMDMMHMMMEQMMYHQHMMMRDERGRR